ncbi:MAG: glycosyltransferase family 2 protein [Actinomycetes bacterium]
MVITRNRWPDLRMSLPRHKVPVVLVDNASTDGTPDQVRRHFPEVQLIELSRNHGAVARNIGVARVTTPFVAFADDDSWWAPSALNRAIEHLEKHNGLGLLAARVLVGNDKTEDPVCRLMSDSALGMTYGLPGPNVLGFVACAAVARRSAFLAAGGFDDVIFFGGEEERLALDLAALGWAICYVDDVVAYHFPSAVRDPAKRAALLARNRLLTLLLRRPWRVVAAELRATMRTGSIGRKALRQAVPLVPKALHNRRLLPPHVEAARVALHAVAQGGPA